MLLVRATFGWRTPFSSFSKVLFFCFEQQDREGQESLLKRKSQIWTQAGPDPNAQMTCPVSRICAKLLAVDSWDHQSSRLSLSRRANKSFPEMLSYSLKKQTDCQTKHFWKNTFLPGETEWRWEIWGTGCSIFVNVIGEYKSYIRSLEPIHQPITITPQHPVLLRSHNVCHIHIRLHTPCNNLVVHPLRNEILTENGCETMFFDEGSVKLNRPWNPVMNYRHLIVWFHSSIAAAVLIYNNCHTCEVRSFSSYTQKYIFLPWWTRKGCGKIKNIWIKNRWHKNSLLAYSHINLRLSESSCLCVSLWANTDPCLQWVWAAWWITEEAVKATEWGSRLTDCNVESPIQMIPTGSLSYIAVWSLVNCKHPFCVWMSFDIRFSVISGRDPISVFVLLLLLWWWF